MTNHTNDLHPQDARTQSMLNREIAARQRYESRSRHSRFWTSANYINDRLAQDPRIARHRKRPLIQENPLIMPL